MTYHYANRERERDNTLIYEKKKKNPKKLYKPVLLRKN